MVTVAGIGKEDACSNGSKLAGEPQYSPNMNAEQTHPMEGFHHRDIPDSTGSEAGSYLRRIDFCITQL